jgi:molybdate transport system regulatory protein
MRIGFKLWFEEEGNPVFGEGRYLLFKAVEREGSIAAAARSLGMSFRSAWTHLDRAEKGLRFALIVRTRGGAGGGSTTLTEEAKHLIKAYEQVERKVDSFVKELEKAGVFTCR